MYVCLCSALTNRDIENFANSKYDSFEEFMNEQSCLFDCKICLSDIRAIFNKSKIDKKSVTP